MQTSSSENGDPKPIDIPPDPTLQPSNPHTAASTPDGAISEQAPISAALEEPNSAQAPALTSKGAGPTDEPTVQLALAQPVLKGMMLADEYVLGSLNGYAVAVPRQQNPGTPVLIWQDEAHGRGAMFENSAPLVSESDLAAGTTVRSILKSLPLKGS